MPPCHRTGHGSSWYSRFFNCDGSGRARGPADVTARQPNRRPPELPRRASDDATLRSAAHHRYRAFAARALRTAASMPLIAVVGAVRDGGISAIHQCGIKPSGPPCIDASQPEHLAPGDSVPGGSLDRVLTGADAVEDAPARLRSGSSACGSASPQTISARLLRSANHTPAASPVPPLAMALLLGPGTVVGLGSRDSARHRARLAPASPLPVGARATVDRPRVHPGDRRS